MKPLPDTRWQTEGEDPDYRFSLANERTFLAWIRTALALLAGALLIHQFAVGLGPRWAVLAFTVSLVLIAAHLALSAYGHWRDNERAMRHALPLPRSFILPFMSAAACCIALCTAVLLVWRA